MYIYIYWPFLDCEHEDRQESGERDMGQTQERVTGQMQTTCIKYGLQWGKFDTLLVFCKFSHLQKVERSVILL